MVVVYDNKNDEDVGNSTQNGIEEEQSSPQQARLRSRRRGARPPEETLPALYGSEAHVFWLQHCRNEFSDYSSVVEDLEDSCRTRQNEMYQLLAIFALIQGVVFAAVAQSTKLDCDHRSLPILLSLTTSLATIFALVRELVDIGVLKEEVQSNKDRASAAYGMMEEMKLRGLDFDLSRELDRGDVSGSKQKWRHVFSAYGMSLLAFLLVLSVGIMFSTAVLLCRGCNCS